MTSGDLDGDGNTDVVAYSASGAYVIRGGVDLEASPNPVSRFSRFVPSDEPAAAASIVETASGPLIVVARPSSNGATEIVGIDPADFVEIARVVAPAPPVDFWMSSVTLPAGAALLVGADARIWLILVERFVAGAITAPAEIPPPPASSWAGAQLAYAFPAPLGGALVIATETSMFRSIVPDSLDTYDWQVIRSGERWLSQRAIYSTANMRDMIVGIADDGATESRLCAIDLVTPSDNGCTSLAATERYEETSMFVGELQPAGALDAFILRAEGLGQAYELQSGIRLSGASLSATSSPAGFILGSSPVFVVPYREPTDDRSKLLVFDRTGMDVYCFRVDAGQAHPCT